MSRKNTAVLIAALAALVALAVAATGSASPAKQQAKGKAAIITDIGGLGDKGFNDLCAKGLADAKKAGIATGRVFISKSAADYIPNLSKGAQEYDLVIAVGFLMSDSTAAVAKKFPKAKFAIVDVLDVPAVDQIDRFGKRRGIATLPRLRMKCQRHDRGGKDQDQISTRHRDPS